MFNYKKSLLSFSLRRVLEYVENTSQQHHHHHHKTLRVLESILDDLLAVGSYFIFSLRLGVHSIVVNKSYCIIFCKTLLQNTHQS